MNKNKTTKLAEVFGERLAELRKSRQLTQYELADQIGLSRAAISYFESRAKNPTLETVEMVANFFNVPATILIADNQDSSKKTGPIPKLDLLIGEVKKMTPIKQRMVVDMLEAALKSK